jgi:AcrR family transcriptional regulator
MNTPSPTSKRVRGPASSESKLLRQAQRRAKLIEAAIAVYGENGYRHSGVKQVCERAGLTQRYFYESFSHSDELLIACYEQINRELIEEFVRARDGAGDDRKARSKAMLLAYFQALQAQPNAANVFLVDIRGISPAVDKAIEQSLTEFSRNIARSLLLSDTPANEFLQAGVLGGIIHIALHWIAKNYTPGIDEVVESALRLGSVLLVEAKQPT